MRPAHPIMKPSANASATPNVCSQYIAPYSVRGDAKISAASAKANATEKPT